MGKVELLQNNGVNVEAGLQFLGSMEFYDETLAEFLNSITEKLNSIKHYKEIGDMSNYAIVVHSLKSDAKYLGFEKLSQLAYQHEMASKQNDKTYVIEHYNELMIEAVRIVSVARKYNVESITNVSNTSNANVAIIVADDSNIIRNFVNKIFSEEYEVLTAIDGHEVIKLIEQNQSKRIAGMLLDLNMPNFNGFEVLEYFKANNLFSKIPVSIITGDDTKDSIDKAFKYPIVDMLNKPFSENDVRKIVNKTISFGSSN